MDESELSQMEQNKEFKEFLKTIRNHRKENHWDVTYDIGINLDGFSNKSLTDFCKKNYHEKNVSYKNISIEKDDLIVEGISPDRNIIIEDINFDTCDFYGNNGGKKLTIKNCIFHKCYFSFSTFNDINFTNCSFESCSFAQAKFYRCIFDDSCTFYNISISGGKTKFVDSEINAIIFFKKIHKPFIEKPNCYKDLNIAEEEYLLAKSIVKLSRNILNSTQSCSNDEYYYLSLKNLCLKKLYERKCYDIKKVADIDINIKNKEESCKTRQGKEKLYIIRKKISQCLLKLKKPAYPVEKFFIYTFGFMNAWGGSLQRVFFIGFMILLTYCFLYFFIDGGQVSHIQGLDVVKIVHAKDWYYFLASLIKSFDVTFLAGYTKHISNHDGLLKQYILLSNMLVGLFWYAVAIPSLISKISVTRI